MDYEIVEFLIGNPEIPIVLPPNPPPITQEVVLDLARHPSSGDVLVVTNGRVVQIDATTGQSLSTILPLPVTVPVATAGLTVAPAMSLNNVGVPAGSLLLAVNQGTSDYVFALDPSTGTVLTSIDLGAIVDPVGITVVPGGQELAILGSEYDQLQVRGR